MDTNEEIQRCKDDPVYFAEKYILINGKPWVLRDSDKSFLRWIHKMKDTPNRGMPLIIKWRRGWS